ncbi:MAG: PorT family protein [Chryseobacterium sp.]|nr:MAG: PorT family protein [Chryseobacterium sp.]
MNILRILLILAMICASKISGAQTSFGVRAGIGFFDVKDKAENGTGASTKPLHGLVIGISAESRLVGDFFIQPTIVYARKGFRQESGGFYGSAKNFRVSADYMELPVNLLYRPKVAAGRLILGAGPYVGYGFGGKWKSDEDILLGDVRIKGEGRLAFRNDGSVRNDSEYIYGRPFDYGLNATVGYVFLERLSLQAIGTFGLANLVPRFGDYQPGGSLKNKGYGISVGYRP